MGVNTRLESDKGIDSSLSGTTGGKIDTTHARTQIPRTLSAIELSWARCLSPWSRFHCWREPSLYRILEAVSSPSPHLLD